MEKFTPDPGYEDIYIPDNPTDEELRNEGIQNGIGVLIDGVLEGIAQPLRVLDEADKGNYGPLLHVAEMAKDPTGTIAKDMAMGVTTWFAESREASRTGDIKKDWELRTVGAGTVLMYTFGARSFIKGIGTPKTGVTNYNYPGGPPKSLGLNEPVWYDGMQFGPGYEGVRVQGPWTKQDLIIGSKGFAPKSFGKLELHHGGQMPGAGIHELQMNFHRSQTKMLHPNGNQGVTQIMREQDRQLHWWYRSQEMGLNGIYPNSVY